MRRRLFTTVLGALLAVVLTPLFTAPGAAADPLPPGAEPSASGVTAKPTCTSWVVSGFHWYRMELLDWMPFPLWTHPANTRTGICATR